jgi:hypothetical protein
MNKSSMIKAFTGAHECKAGTYHFDDGLLHSLTGPAAKCDARFGLPYEEYWINGKIQREGAPAIKHSSIREEWWEKRSCGRIPERPNRRYLHTGSPTVKASGINKPLLLDPEFNKITRLSESHKPWNAFPIIDSIPLADHIDEVFGGNNAFGLLGDYGILPQKFINLLFEYIKPDFAPKLKLDYSRKWSNFPGRSPVHSSIHAPTNPVGVLDYLGSYCCVDKVITLYPRTIAECAEDLDRVLGGRTQPCAMTLATLVYYHELGHAIDHHQRGGVKGDNLGGLDRSETVAQLIALAVTNEFGARGMAVEEALSNNQPSCYSLWRGITTNPKMSDIAKLLEANMKFRTPTTIPPKECMPIPEFRIPYLEYWRDNKIVSMQIRGIYDKLDKADQDTIDAIDIPDF